MNSAAQLIVRILIPVSIVGAGLAVQAALVASKAKTEAIPQKDLGVSVRTQKVKACQTERHRGCSG